MIVLGVDPGAVDTGLVLVDTSDTHNGQPSLLGSWTINRAGRGKDGGLLPVNPEYLAEVLDHVQALIDSNSPPRLVGVEGVKRPNWHAGGAAANPEAILATAVVFGAVLGHLPTNRGLTFVEIPPGKNGSGALVSYPPALVSDSERRRPSWRLSAAGAGKLRHERSAYDVARAAAAKLPTSMKGTR